VNGAIKFAGRRKRPRSLAQRRKKGREGKGGDEAHLLQQGLKLLSKRSKVHTKNGVLELGGELGHEFFLHQFQQDVHVSYFANDFLEYSLKQCEDKSVEIEGCHGRGKK
jgi:hypothetical protein